MRKYAPLKTCRVIWPAVLVSGLAVALTSCQPDGGSLGGARPSQAGGNTGSPGSGGSPAATPGSGGSSAAAGAAGGSGGASAAVPGSGGSGAAPAPAADGGAIGGDAAAPPDGVAAPAGGLDGKAWEAMYPRDKRRMIIRDEGKSSIHYVNLANPAENWVAKATGWARGMQLVGNNVLLGGRSDGYEEYDLKDGKILKQVKAFGNTQSAYRMADGDTMLTINGTNLVFLDSKTDAEKKRITYSGYGYVRMARPTPQGTFLVPADQTLFEGDDKGTVLWKTTGAGWGHIWEAIRLPGGNVAVATAFGASLDIVDATTHKVIQRMGTKSMPEAATVKPNFFGEFQVLPNGNFICSNWQGHGGGNGGSGIQILEFDPTGKLVWSWKQDATIYSSIQGIMVLDGLDPMKLHVQTVNGQWTPVP